MIGFVTSDYSGSQSTVDGEENKRRDGRVMDGGCRLVMMYSVGGSETFVDDRGLNDRSSS